MVGDLSLKYSGVIHQQLDATGMLCPMPLLKMKLALKNMAEGEILRLTADDSGSLRDIPLYIHKSNHSMIEMETCSDVYQFLIKKG